MSSYLFLQRFHQQKLGALPFEEVCELLAARGRAEKGINGEIEFVFAAGTVAERCVVLGNSEEGVVGIAFEGPRFDEPLRQLVWHCIAHWACAVFDDSLDLLHVRQNGLPDLPEAMVLACRMGVRPISTSQQLWPLGLALKAQAVETVSLEWGDPGVDSVKRKLALRQAPGKQQLAVNVNLKPAACNPATLRMLRLMEVRVDAALLANPGWQVSWNFAHLSTMRMLLDETSPLGTLRYSLADKARVDSALSPTRFVADRQVQSTVLASAEQFRNHARTKHKVEFDGLDFTNSLRIFSKLLDRVHQLCRQERLQHKSDALFTSRLAVMWAVRGGAYLGEMIRNRVGGQWGQLSQGALQYWVMRCHSGRICHPHLVVLDHILNGHTFSVKRWFQRLVLSDTRASAAQEDWASDIPALCNILLAQPEGDSADVGAEIGVPVAAGSADAGESGDRTANFLLPTAGASAGRWAASLPVASEVPREQLNFSLSSLHQLDAYLALVARHDAKLDDASRLLLMRTAGAYLGEVIRGLASPAWRWQWANYDDRSVAEPDFSQARERQPAYGLMLHDGKRKLFPFALVAALMRGFPVQGSFDFVRQLLADEAIWPEPFVEPPAAPAVPAPTIGFDKFRALARKAEPVVDSQLVEARKTLDSWRAIATRTDYKLLVAPCPEWLRHKPLVDGIEQQDQLLAEGSIVWAAVVQADKLLYQQGPGDLPALLLFSRDPGFDSKPEELQRVAEELQAVHPSGGANLSRQLTASWRLSDVEDSPNRWRIPVPTLLTEREVLVSPVVVFRRHLPGEALKGPMLPVLIHPAMEGPMILPRRFWPQALVAQWSA